MRNNWHKIPHSRHDGKWKSINVTMTPKGQISMNKAAWQAAGEPKFVELLFDSANSQIGLQPTYEQNPDAYKVTTWNSVRTWRVAARRLLDDFKIKLPATVKFYDAEVNEHGILVLDLRTARVPPNVINHYRNRNNKTEDGS